MKGLEELRRTGELILIAVQVWIQRQKHRVLSPSNSQ
jgi:hypothetical protein